MAHMSPIQSAHAAAAAEACHCRSHSACRLLQPEIVLLVLSRPEGLGLRVEGFGFRAQGLGFVWNKGM